ncbi:MAG: hypothetical protein H6618_09090 [Deltaproteobacteria bacterium]|nr:hypothetical protein [Deltaproteobacteria bacterium]
MTGPEGQTALSLARDNDFIEVVAKLIEAGAEIIADTVTEPGRTVDMHPVIKVAEVVLAFVVLSGAICAAYTLLSGPDADENNLPDPKDVPNDVCDSGADVFLPENEELATIL